MNKGTTFAISAAFSMIAAAIMILGIFFSPSDLLSEDVIAQVMGSITVGRYTSSGPIMIDSNADFSSSPAVSSGDGSVANPWIIEGFDINGSGKGCGIYIGNTTEHFIVRNCYIHHTNGSGTPYYWAAGVAMYKVTNGTIEGNSIDDNPVIGVTSLRSSSLSIRNNSVRSNGRGIHLRDSNENRILDNNVSNNDNDGILLAGSHYNVVEQNVADRTKNGDGIKVYQSDHNLVISNSAVGNWRDGIYLQVSAYNDIISNKVGSNGLEGISVYASGYNNITDNSLHSNIRRGILVSKSNHNNISGNLIINNTMKGIGIELSFENLVIDNMISNTDGDGIHLTDSKRHMVHGNSLIDNVGRGVWLDSNSNNNTVSKNDIQRNEFGLLLTEQSNNNLIIDNLFSENDHGIRLSDSNDNIVHHNTLLGNPDQSLDDGIGNRWYMDYPICGNHWSDHAGSDQFNGISQDVVGADGISDTPYSNIHGTAGSIDRYPLLHKGMNGADVSPPSSSMISFDICTSDPTLNLTANAEDGQSEVVSVEFWYQYRSFSGTWSLWKKHSTDMTESDGWSVGFVFPEGEGYYQFKSRATDLIGHYEADKVNAEAQCCYDHTPPVLIDNSSDIGRTGENYLPRYLLSDHSGIHDVHFIYRFGQEGWIEQPSIGYLDGYIPIPIPENSTDPLQFNITATDLAGNNASLFKEVPVLDVIAPNASAGTDITIDEDTIVTFNGSGSFDNIAVFNLTWSFIDGGTNMVLFGQGPTYLFDSPGVYSITLSVLDGANNTASDVLVVTVLDITDPVADAGHDINVTEGTLVLLNGSGSTDNVDITDLTWTFNDGLNDVKLQGALVSHNFSKAGNYTVTLTVKDATGNIGSDTMLVRVNELPSDDDDDNDDDEDDDEDDDGPDGDDDDVKWVLSPLICSGIALVILFLLLMILVLIVMLAGRRSGKGPHEE